MRVPLSWLKEYVDITLSIPELGHRLTLAGLEIAHIEYIGVPCDVDESRRWKMPFSTDHLVWDREKVVVGHILEVKPHPDADRLTLAMVESGIGQVETVVNGAVNLVPYVGQGPINPPLVACYAREGAELLDPYADNWPHSRMILKPKKLRGIENRSMVCSERELGLTDAHEGILLLDTDAAPGTPLQDALGDVILDIDLTPNMARNFSIIGVAREVAALTGQKVRYPSQDVAAKGAAIGGQVKVEIRQPDLNPRFTAALIKGVTIGPSPEWMQRRLKLAGMRPISNVVDVTNYVMLELGEPLHAFDYDVLVKRAGGKPPTILTRLPERGEKLTTLDGVERELDPYTILVADNAGALSLGGIMGGAESEVHDGTTSVLLEAASWNFINIRQTLSAQRNRGAEISSEAGARFSRGVHPAQASVGLRRAIELMRQIGGGEVAQGIVDEHPNPYPEVTVDLPLSEIGRWVGIEVSQDEAARILEGLEFRVERVGKDAIRATAPDHRLDIGYLNFESDADIAETIARADLLEEIARIYGYDRIPTTMISDVIPPQRANPRLTRDEQIRDLLVTAGLTEVINYRLTTPEREARLVPPGAASDWPDVPYVTIANPISADRAMMRHTLLAGVLEVVASNARWRSRQAVFELGSVYLPVEGQELPDEPRRLCLALTGERALPAWQAGADAEPEMMDFYDLKGVVEALAHGLHLSNVKVEAGQHSTFFPGRVAMLRSGKRRIGHFGELHPLVREAYGLPDQPVLVAELDVEALQASIDDEYQIAPISIYPAIYQDIAVIVDESAPAAEVEAVIREAGGSLLRDARLFDLYRGEQIGEGQKSLAYALTFQSDEKVLKDKEADRAREKITQSLERRLGAKLRS